MSIFGCRAQFLVAVRSPCSPSEGLSRTPSEGLDRKTTVRISRTPLQGSSREPYTTHVPVSCACLLLWDAALERELARFLAHGPEEGINRRNEEIMSIIRYNTIPHRLRLIRDRKKS